MTMEGNALSTLESQASQPYSGNKGRRGGGSDTERNVLQEKGKLAKLLWSPPLAADVLSPSQRPCHTLGGEHSQFEPPTLLRQFEMRGRIFASLKRGRGGGERQSSKGSRGIQAAFLIHTLSSLPPFPSFQVLVSQTLAMCYRNVTNLVCRIGGGLSEQNTCRDAGGGWGGGSGLCGHRRALCARGWVCATVHVCLPRTGRELAKVTALRGRRSPAQSPRKCLDPQTICSLTGSAVLSGLT